MKGTEVFKKQASQQKLLLQMLLDPRVHNKIKDNSILLSIHIFTIRTFTIRTTYHYSCR